MAKQKSQESKLKKGLPRLMELAMMFFASPFWKKLQSKNGKSCRTKMAKVAKLLYLTALLPECCLLCRYTWFNASRRAVYVGVGPTAMLPHPDLCFCFPFSHPSS